MRIEDGFGRQLARQLESVSDDINVFLQTRLIHVPDARFTDARRDDELECRPEAYKLDRGV